MRADKIKAGYSLAGFPNRNITKVERFTKMYRPGEPWPKQWVRITTETGKVLEAPPDWDLQVWTNTSKDDDDDQGDGA